MPSENIAQKYLAEILIAVNKLNERNGSQAKSIVEYIRQNLLKNSNPRCELLSQRIRRNLQSAVQLKLLRCSNGKFRLHEGIEPRGKIGTQRGHRRGKSRTPPKKGKHRRRSGSNRRRRGSRKGGGKAARGSTSDSKAKTKTNKSPTPQNKKIQNQEQPDNENAEDVEGVSNNNSSCSCNN